MKVTRREALIALAGTTLYAKGHGESRLSVEGYIFQQFAARQKKSLGEVLDEVFEMARVAGFRNIEINQGFFTPELKDRTLALLRAKSLRMPSVYVGGEMHTREGTVATIANALEIAHLCQPFGCVGVVNNPDPLQNMALKSDFQLKTEAEGLNNLGEALKTAGSELRVHHHVPELLEKAREWNFILNETNPKLVKLCLDLDWAHQAGADPLEMLRQGGNRVHEIHVRNSKDKLWLEDLEDGDVNYQAIAAYMKEHGLKPLIVVELAYRDNTTITRPLADDLRLSRLYAEQVFGVHV